MRKGLAVLAVAGLAVLTGCGAPEAPTHDVQAPTATVSVPTAEDMPTVNPGSLPYDRKVCEKLLDNIDATPTDPGRGISREGLFPHDRGLRITAGRLVDAKDPGDRAAAGVDLMFECIEKSEGWGGRWVLLRESLGARNTGGSQPS